MVIQANFRRTNVATKLKLTYVKDTFLDVSVSILSHSPPLNFVVSRSNYNTKHVCIDTSPFSRRLLNDLWRDSGDDWSDCFRVDKISLPQAPFLGFSAMTGDVFDAHEYVIDFLFKTALIPDTFQYHLRSNALSHTCQR